MLFLIIGKVVCRVKIFGSVFLVFVIIWLNCVLFMFGMEIREIFVFVMVIELLFRFLIVLMVIFVVFVYFGVGIFKLMV